MFIPESDRYPEQRIALSTWQVRVAADAVCRDVPYRIAAYDAFRTTSTFNVRRAARDVARDELRREVRELLGPERRVPCTTTESALQTTDGSDWCLHLKCPAHHAPREGA